LTLLCVFYLYLGFHALSGDQGILKWANYQDEINGYKTEITELNTRIAKLEKRAKMLRADGLDLDLLDEQARRDLNVSRANEVVIWLDETP